MRRVLAVPGAPRRDRKLVAEATRIGASAGERDPALLPQAPAVSSARHFGIRHLAAAPAQSQRLPARRDRAQKDRGVLRRLRPHRRSERAPRRGERQKSEEHTSELQSLMRISYAVFCLKKKNNIT